jgi:hypothetical protein
LPLKLRKLKRIADRWIGFVAGGGSLYQVLVLEGTKSPSAAHAAVVRALGSIRRAG